MKKVLVASAIAAAIGGMSVAQAESTLTGSLRYGINANSDAVTLQNYGSRIKYDGSNDAGVFGKLELRLADSRNGTVVNRHYAVGMGGDWGKVSLGVLDPAFDAVGDRNLSWWNGGFGLLGSNEAHGGIRFDKSMGAVSIALSAHAFADTVDDTGAALTNADDAIDRVDASLLYSADALTFGVAVASLAGGEPNNDGSKTAVHLGYKFDGGQVRATVGSQDADFSGAAGDKSGLNLQAAFGNVYGWYGQTEVDGSNQTATHIGLGYTQSLSDRALIWYELFSSDPDDGSDAVTSLNAALKFDF